MVDATVEHDDRRAIDDLPIDDASEVGAGGTDEEPAGFEEEARAGEDGVGRPRPRSGPRDLDRAPRRRAPRRPGGTGCPGRRRRRRARPSCRSGWPGRGRPQRSPAHVRRARSRPGRSRRRTRAGRATRGAASGPPASRRRSRSASSIPNLPAPASPMSRTVSVGSAARPGGPEHDRDAAPAVGGDRLEARQLAGRLHRHGADPGLDGRHQLVVALARPGHDDPAGLDPGAQGRGQLAGRSHVRTESVTTEVRDDGQ